MNFDTSFDNECFVKGIFEKSYIDKQIRLGEFSSYLETLLGSSPQFCYIQKSVFIKDYNKKVLFGQGMRVYHVTQNTTENMISLSPPPKWDLTYIGQKIKENDPKRLMVLVYNVLESSSYDDPTKLLKSMGYKFLGDKNQSYPQKMIRIEVQEKEHVMTIDIRPLVLNRNEEIWIKDKVKDDLDNIAKADVEIRVKCLKKDSDNVVLMLERFAQKIKKYVTFSTDLTDDHISAYQPPSLL